MINFVNDQPLCVSTAQEEANYFTGERPPVLQPDLNAILPQGSYRVIDGRLYRVVEGVRPSFQTAHEQ